MRVRTRPPPPPDTHTGLFPSLMPPVMILNPPPQNPFLLQCDHVLLSQRTPTPKSPEQAGPQGWSVLREGSSCQRVAGADTKLENIIETWELQDSVSLQDRSPGPEPV